MRIADSKWPPPTAGMTVDEMKNLRLIAEHLINHLKQEIPKACGKVGHQWSLPVKESGWTNIPVNRGPFCRNDSSDYRDIDAESQRWEQWKRKCNCCGEVEIRDVSKIEVNPFDGKPVKQ